MDRGSWHCTGDRDQDHPYEKENKKKKNGWLSAEDLQIAVKREAKSKGEKERYTHLNAEFKRIARRDKKAYLHDQCKQRKTIEWERLEISSRKLEIAREHFIQRWHSKGQKQYGPDRNSMGLTEEDIKERWQEYIEELYKKDLHDPDNHDGVITHLQPDILECEVKWALEALLWTKLVEVIEFQLSYFKF